MEPVYLKSYRNGILKEKAKILKDRLKCCTLCPRNCQVDRLSGETGICKTGEYAVVSSYTPHFGEEAPLVGHHGVYCKKDIEKYLCKHNAPVQTLRKGI